MEQPVWVNNSDVFNLSKDSIIIKSNDTDVDAVLYSFTQPITLTKEPINEGYVFSPENPSGIIEGPARLVVSSNAKMQSYKINLVNENVESIEVFDYRSPKTINPDSSLKQHQIIHHIDQWRNISFVGPNDSLFYENTLQIEPKVGFYRVFKDKPLSSYYVQAGSATELKLNFEKNYDKKVYVVGLEPLKDEYSNMVSEGTLVRFHYTESGKYFTKEVQLIEGKAKIEIDLKPGKVIKIWAQVHNLKSSLLEIVP